MISSTFVDAVKANIRSFLGFLPENQSDDYLAGYKHGLLVAEYAVQEVYNEYS